ncbi:MAG: hydrogenase formation protein HypD [Desulfobacterales bacterium]|jgi:hydrogenase expression/formation protein HypD|nr:hydrogenase formation protein HypD [Desulfobacterales bacterium]
MNYTNGYRDPGIAGQLADRIRRISRRKVRLMEVCGTHTVSIFRSGIRSLLPDTVTLISGPGCPVCVTDQRDMDAFIALAGFDDVIVATFGDLMRVPGTHSSLLKERAKGSDIRIVYSPLDAITIATENPYKRVVFPGVGFETTAPTIAATLNLARDRGIHNFFVYSAHKLVPPALTALMALPEIHLDGFMLPGHVSVIIGAGAYRPFVARHSIPAVIAGFEPTDILLAIAMLVEQIESGASHLENAYSRVVSEAGNPKALALLADVFEVNHAAWRGLGVIADSGLKLRKSYEAFDAEQAFDLVIPESFDPAGCACGDILTGRKLPSGCPLFGKICTPEHPVGPCMVSTEGTCAAYYRYDNDSGAF